tara:strand:+ start:363 stop:809 length:447 start_codon:yes stop_codon:yes gene_type:complete
MDILFDDSQFVSIINLFKKEDNWVDILETAAENVADEILEDAKAKVYQKLKRQTGGIADSLDVDVSTSGNTVSIEIGSSHPAAAIIEYGGYSPFPPWGSSSGLPFPVAKKIYENQPFAQPRPFLRPAVIENMSNLEKEVYRVANQKIP